MNTTPFEDITKTMESNTQSSPLGFILFIKKKVHILKKKNDSGIIMTSFFCQSEGHRSEGKSIWEDTDLSEKRFQRTHICGVKGHGFGGTVIL